jgi:amino acid adenylation domain-containing protein
MIDQERLQGLTESYLKALISEVSDSLSSDFDSFAPFGELGIDSFNVLKIIRRLEADFGALPKTLLFENFTINDLGNYFVCKHEQTLVAKFGEQLHVVNDFAHTNGWKPKPADVPDKTRPSAANRVNWTAEEAAAPIRILETKAYSHPELRELVQTLYIRYKRESSVSRGTRKIAPNLFIGREQRGYFNYGRNKNLILVYGYTGPQNYLPVLLEEMYQYCCSRNFQLNVLADKEIPPLGDVAFSATPFGVGQRLLNLKQFTLEGGAMRRLRYQISKFHKSGVCKTQEYQCGSKSEIDKNIVAIIDKWCEPRTQVNPLVYEAREEILAGTLGTEHRLFLTFLDNVLQNVILITAMCSEENGYLMDLEFYLPDMPLGGLEVAIVHIISTLVGEGCNVLSLGATLGCKLDSSPNADSEIDKILDDLREQNIFNDGGNLQFKNKFRPENKTIFLCRPAGSGNPDSVIDIIMMIADPLKNQTSEEENYNAVRAPLQGTVLAEAAKRRPSAKLSSVSSERVVIDGSERSRILAEFGFNPLNVPHEHVEFDLKTDSWAQLQMPSIEAQMRNLHAQLQQPANVDEALRAVFPCAHFVLTASGQAAEDIFFKAWPKRGVVLQNLLFPSTIFHQIDKGFTNKELPDPAVFDLNSPKPYKGNMDWEALRKQVAQDPSEIALGCIEVSNNAAGGCPVSMGHLRDVKALLAKHAIPLVIDGTRVVENAQFLIEQDREYTGRSVWTVVREMLSFADAVIGSLTKDFCVNKGGIITTNDVKLFHRLEELVHEAGSDVDLIDRKMIALSLQNRKQVEARVLRRMEGVRRIWHALREHNIPVVQPAGGHCVLIDIKQMPEFKNFKYPVASFLAWMYVNTGIRAAAHSVGMQKHTNINDLVRLAIPVGMKREQIDDVISRLLDLFNKKVNIPEIALESSVLQPLGGVHANYRLINYHNIGGKIVAADSATTDSQRNIADAISSASRSVATSTKPSGGSSPGTLLPARNTARKADSIRGALNDKPRKVEDIAIIGMAGRYPKAKNLSELWENLSHGKDCIEEIPAERYELRLKQGATKKYPGGFIDDMDKFDSLFFNISPREAAMLDPQERLFLEVAWEAIEDAGYYPEILASEDGSRNIGVFVGAVWAMYQMFDGEEDQAGKKIKPNSFLWSIANRVSYWMNLSGPSLTLDTACSSSLTALHLACEAIHAGECSATIVGGVNLDLHEAKLEINSGGGGLSKDGVCRSFGKGADGYVAGEGIGALFLKPFEHAIRDKDNIYGVIKSAVVNHGGHTSGYTIPSPKAQTNLILSAFEKANLDARSISYVEAHGTGTELGDPIEISGLSSAFKSHAVENQTCAVGSIKSNIGHLEAAAGVVSVSKVLLQMKHRQLVPSLHCSQLSEFIDFANSPFYVVQRLEDWKSREVDGVQVPLRAGISSFGAGGANAHVILESYEPLQQLEEEPDPTNELIFPLSARAEDQLREMAVRLAKAVKENNYRLMDVAHTLQVGRKSFEHRLAIRATAREELLDRLACFLSGKKSEGIARGQVKNSESITRLLNRKEKEEFIQLLSQSRTPYELAELWVDGLFADWRGFESNARCKRVSLPTYPFADKRHWAGKNSPARASLQLAAAIHPMIDTNESTFERQLFKKTFHDRDFFIYDHHVADIPTLPGVAYLEFARKAGEIAAGRRVQKIKNVVWISPIAVQNSTPKEVFIELKPSDTTVRFEVFSYDKNGCKLPHSQGTLLYATRQEETAEPEFIDLQAVRARCAKVIDGKDAYPRFKSFGLGLGPSFQVLHEVYKNENETLGVLKLPEFRQNDLQSMVLQPSLIDGSMQAGMGAHLGEELGEMFVPFSIGEVEVLQPLQANCFSYATEMQGGKNGNRESIRFVKSDVLIVDEKGKVLIKIRESVGVPLREVHKKTAPDSEADGFSKLYYSYEWEKAPLIPENPPPNSHAIVLFDTQETLRDLYRERLIQKGKDSDQVILVQPGDSFQDVDGHSYRINPRNKEDYTKLFQLLVESKHPIENICFAWPLGHPDLLDEKCVDEALVRGVYSFLFVCQSLIQQKLESKVQLLYVYSAKQDETQPSNEAVSGFIKALRVEHPKLVSKTLEVRQDGSGYDQILNAVSAEFQAQTQDATAVRYQAEERYIKKLRILKLEEATDVSPSQGIGLKDKGVYLITGGAGGLGLIFAEFLAKEHKAKLVLTGRSKLSKEQEAKLNALTSAGAEVLYLPADVSNREDVRKLVNESKARFGQINGIIHAAGVLRDSFVRNKKPEEMSAVFAPKIYGTLHLDEATQNENLDFLVMFSSVAAVGGNAGQCDYSFANHFMDSFVSARELLRVKGTRSGKTLSLNWSLWADGGMKVDEQTELYFKKTLGIKPLSTATGLEAFVKGLASEKSQFAVVEGVQEKVELVWGLRKRAPAMSAPASSGQAQTPTPDGKDADLVAWLQEELSEIVMQFLKLEAEDVATDKILLDLGFDSIGLTTFANTINEKFHLDITPVLFFDYPSIAEIAKYLAGERKNELFRFYQGSAGKAQMAAPLQGAHPRATTQPVENPQEATFAISKGWNPSALDREVSSHIVGGGFSPEQRFANQPIAIVGTSGVMPQSEDLDEFWENLKNAKDMITVIPPDRWRWEDYYGDPLKEANKSNSKWGGFMKEIDKFDPLFFGISPREAQMMDPQQRIFLETVWKAIEDSGQKVSDLSGSRTGLFVGVAADDYAHLINSLRIVLDGYSAAGNSHSVLANRVSFLLNLHGPSAPIDTACSSSLIALHRAIESIHTGSCDMAIVGGVQIMLTPAGHIAFGSAGMLSSDGKCKTFDKRANGYVRGEGCGAIFLKTLKAAEADGNHIYAVVRATAENHGGKVTTLTAPNSSAQSALLVEAYEKAHIDPTTVGYIECHGTGTSLGDPIEIQALSKAFSELYKKHKKAPAPTPHCGLSSVKTNIGHLETAAGIASVLKVLLAIKHKQIPANINLEEINPYINLKGTPFYIAEKLTPWEAATAEDGLPVPRRAGVSSFGFGGANAHVVLEEYIPPRRASARPQEPQLVVLSAKNEDRLKAYVQRMHTYLEEEYVDLTDFAYTLQVGRDEMPERLALVVSSTEDLKQKFAEILKGEKPKDCYCNNIRSKNAKSQTPEGSGGETLVRELIGKKELSKLAELWVHGAKIDWYSLHKSDAPRRISAPTYPFARERHWLPGAEGKTMEPRRDQSQVAVAHLHPLIHRNASTLAVQKFASWFNGREFFLADHKTGTDALLPAVGYVEMIAAAGEFSGEQKIKFIRDMVWMTPLTVKDDAREVEVLLTPVKNEVDFAVRTLDKGHSITHCRGKLSYSGGVSEPHRLIIAEIQERCSEEIIAGKDLYAFIATSGISLGKSYQVVQKVYAGKSEYLAVMQLPEHLKSEADRFWLHPAMADGAVHTAIALVKKTKADIPWSTADSVGQVQISRSLKDVYYAHATWDIDSVKDEKSVIKINVEYLDEKGTVLVRMRDFAVKPLLRAETQVKSQREASHPDNVSEEKEAKAELQYLIPVWNRVRPETGTRSSISESTKIILLGGHAAQLDWLLDFNSSSQLLQLAPNANVEAIGKELASCAFDQLLWIAPDVHSNAGGQSGSDELIEQQEQGVVAVFRIIKALLQSGHASKKLQWTFITSRTQRVVENDRVQPSHAGVAGLVGSLAKEYPQWNLRLIDVDSLASVSARECLSLPWDKQGNGLAHREGEWFQQELTRMGTLPQGPSLYRQNGVYVVIGGAGGIGEVWSRFMIENYQAKLVWIGRRECNPTIQEKINSMARLGHAPLYISADATKLDALEQAFKTIREPYPTIHGVVHSAIVLHDQSIARMEEAGFRAGLAAKVDTSVNMDRVFGNQELDFMLFFSSIVSFVKSPGQSNYSAGCTFKDCFAQKLQQQRSYPVKIMNWGYWGDVGVVADEFHNQLMRRMGIASIEAHEGMASLQDLVNSEVRQIALFKTFEATAGLPISEVIAKKLLLQPLVEVKHADKKTRDMAGAKNARKETQSSRSAELKEHSGNDYVKRIIVETLSDALRMDAASIRFDAPMAEYGVDSIIGVHLVRTINETLQIELEPVSLFEYSTVDALTQHIWTMSQKEITAQLGQVQKTSQEPDSTGGASPESDRTLEHRFIQTELAADADKQTDFVHVQEDNHGNAGVEPIAIIGMSGRFAGSESLDEFWQNLEQGKNLIKKVSRWSASECVTSGSENNGYCCHGGFIDSIDQFDPMFFRISPAEAVYMDPQQRLFLEEAWKALEDAGYAGHSVNEARCGTYVGCGPTGYGTLFLEEPPAHAFWGNSQSIIPARIAYHLNLQGPAIAVDTACSSSLVSVHLACQGLWSREIDMALAGGVCLNPTPVFYQVSNRARMLSPDGQCRSFDAKANGFVPGEGVGVIVLKRLRDALRDGDYIHGVIAGSGINQDGASNGLLAPNARAQETLERSVYDRFKINPETIQVIETHGTGTIVGDAIECLAITRAFREYTDKKQFCAIGTVKTNVGHTGTASGIAGILKLLLSLKHRRIPPSLHFQSGNPAIDFKSNPFYVNTQLKEWRVEDNQRRRGAVSAFGFSGTNAHLVIEEALSVKRATVELPGYIAVLSARTQEQLKQQVQHLLALLKRTTGFSMNDLSFTLFVGRMHLSCRLSCVAGNQEELIHFLEQWIETGTATEVYTSDIQEGRVRENISLKKFGSYCIRECKNATDAAAYLENLAAIAELYVKGYSLDFRALFPPESKRIPLPTYPFARERYWLYTNGVAKAQPMPATAALDPLGPMEVRIASDRAYVAPESKVEKQLVEIWADVLKLAPEKIGINDNFFELGGHSLLATQLMGKIRGKMDIDLPLTAVFEQSSVAQLAGLCVKAAKSVIPPIPPVDRAQFERLPLSFAQERLWFFEQLQPGTNRYNLPVAVTISGGLDIDQLDQAFNLIIARHESLRTVFPSQEGQVQQLIMDSLNFKLERIDLSHYTNKEVLHSKAKEICQKEAARPFDLARGPLLRGHVIKLGEQEHVLLLTMHHIISDGWSLSVLTRELDLITEALRQGRRPNLPPLPIQYVDYVVWQRTRLEAGGLLKQQLDYWQEKLAGVPEILGLPTDYPRPEVTSFVGATYEFALDAELTEKLKRLAERKNGTLYMVLLAAFKVLVYRYSGQSDICVGSLIANRQYAETTSLIGMFVNMLALRTQVEGDDTFSALLSRIKATCLEAYEHQDTPFEKVVDGLRRDRNAAVNPIFQVMVILHNLAIDLHFSRYSFENPGSKLDLTVQFIETQNGLDVSMEYSTALYKPQTIARMAENFTNLCKAIIATPTAKIRDLGYLNAAENHQPLVEYNKSHVDYPRDTSDTVQLSVEAGQLNGYPENEILRNEIKGGGVKCKPELVALFESSAEGAADVGYWQRQLDANLPAIELFSDLPRSVSPGFERKTLVQDLPEALSYWVDDFAQEHCLPSSVIFLAVFQLLLHRYTNQDDIIVGMPVRGRVAEQLVAEGGHCVNMVPIRTHCDERLRLVQFLRIVQSTVQDAIDHLRYPFSLMLDKLKVKQTWHNSVFQVTYIYKNALQRIGSMPSSQKNGVYIENVADIVQEGNCDFGLEVLEHAPLFSLHLKYNPEFYTQHAASRFVEHYCTLLREMSERPDLLLQRYPIIAEQERHRLLVEFNNTRADYPRGKCVHELFAEQLRVNPDKGAVAFVEQKLSYQELDDKSRDLALYLQLQGVKPDSVVGLCAERSLEMMLGIIGTVQAGGAYLPLDPDFPEGRLSYMMQDSQARVVLTQEKFRKKIGPLLKEGTQLVTLDTQWPEISACVGALKKQGIKVACEVKPGNLCYVIYTSGSTGNPKGVPVEHQALMNRLHWMQNRYPLTRDDVVLQKTPYSFDVSVWEFFWPMIAGASLVFAVPDGHRDVRYLENIINEAKITTLHYAPSMLHMFLDNAKAECRSVKQIFCSGEALDKKSVDDYKTKFPNAVLHNLYGPTEAAIDVTAYDCSQLSYPFVPIGTPIDNTQIYILDPHNHLQPMGVPGELHIAGDGLARGYLNRPELTQEKFVANPFQPGTRMYKTGDLARWLEDGNIQYLGRIDTQVKIGGIRIETGEIEAQLNQYPGIQDSVVVAQGQEANKQLIAFYRAKDSTADHLVHLPYQELRAQLSRALPEYMVPAVFVSLAEIPLNSNGKVDRRALARMEVRIASDQEYVAPRTETEKQLVEIWAEVLKLTPQRIGVNDTFFELGGHSLLATQLISKIRSQLDIDLRVKDLFEHTSITQLAELIVNTETSTIPAIRPVDRTKFDQLPLSFAQERLWFIDQMEPNSPGYNLPAAVTIRGGLNIDQLQQALNHVIARHEILRTVFPGHEGQAHQLILDKLDFRFDFTDLSHYTSKEERHGKAKEICRQEAARPFDLVRGPLFHGKVIKLADREHILLLCMHHIISDGWSLGVLINDLGLIMKALRQGRHPDLSPLPIQYVDYSVWQRTVLEAGGVLKQQLTYWQKKLAGVPESLDLATDYPRPSVQSLAGATHAFTLDAQLTGKLKSIAQHKGATLYMVLLAAFKVLLYRYTSQSDFCVGTPIANRQYGETEGLIGMFVNTLALRSQIEGEDTFSALLSRVKATCLEAYEHQDAPFEKVVDMLQPQRNLAITPLFQVMVILQNATTETLEQDFQLYPLETDVSKFDLIVDFTETVEGLAGAIEYSTALYKPQTIARIAGQFTALCEAVTTTPTAKIRDLDYLSDAEKQLLLVEYNNTRADYPRDKCIHDFFVEQVRRNPGQQAVRFGDEELSYQDLYQRSGDLALYLQFLGVKQDSVVGLCVERSLEMMVGIMGIVRAGGAYLPADPANPDDRLEYMLQDSQATVVLTQERFRNKLKSLLLEEVKLVTLDKQWPEISQSAAALKAQRTELRREVQSHNLSYLIYTSGSTGRPKGVLVEHRALVNRINWMQKRYRLTKDDLVLQKTPYSFDVSVWECFWPMMAGASLVFAAPDGHKDVEYLEHLITQAKVTTLHFVPSMLHSFLENARGSCGSVRQIFCSGEALDKKSVDDYKTKFPNAVLHNLYGPTEAAIDVTAYDCSQLSYPFVPIGTPIDNTQIYILDPHNHLQPMGVPGELHIAGDGLARGYLNRPELTQEKFVANPFQPGTRMYKTGDLARWLEDGNIQYLGRVDTQVKIRGFRIELGEIEARLNQHAEIQDCAVIAQGQEGNKQLIAFYRAKNTQADQFVHLPYEGLRAHLSQTLPEYMVPAAFVSVPAIPLSSNGKVDRRALERKDVKITSGHPYLAPRTNTEKQLVEIWAEVLKQAPQKIGISDSFFGLGGHSLSAVQLMAKINRRFNQSLPLAIMFTAPNIAALAKLISTKEAASLDILVPIQTSGGEPPIFAVPGIGGNVLSLQPLSKALDSNQPFYGLQAVGLDGKMLPLSTVEQTAQANIVALKTIQAHGPYRLVGHSYGGVVAYEMARMLLEQGEQVSSLVLLDAVAPSVMQEEPATDEANELFQACTTASNLYGIHLEIDLDRLRRSSNEETVRYIVSLLNDRGLEITAGQLSAFYAVYRANLVCYRTYKPSKLSSQIDISLYCAAQRRQEEPILPLDYGWNQLLQEPIRIFDVEADHFSILEKVHIHGLAEGGKAYDSLAEASKDDVNRPLAVANYQGSLQPNPNNGHAVEMLQRRNAS